MIGGHSDVSAVLQTMQIAAKQQAVVCAVLSTAIVVDPPYQEF